MEDRFFDWLIKFVSMSIVFIDNYVVFNIFFIYLSKILINFYFKYGRFSGRMGKSFFDFE